ncbi:hypothetical protein Tco_0595025 [Tanacetum coccineum]
MNRAQTLWVSIWGRGSRHQEVDGPSVLILSVSLRVDPSLHLHTGQEVQVSSTSKNKGMRLILAPRSARASIAVGEVRNSMVRTLTRMSLLKRFRCFIKGFRLLRGGSLSNQSRRFTVLEKTERTVNRSVRKLAGMSKRRKLLKLRIVSMIGGNHFSILIPLDGVLVTFWAIVDCRHWEIGSSNERDCLLSVSRSSTSTVFWKVYSKEERVLNALVE